MQISKIVIKPVAPNEKGLIGFVSFVVDNWLYVGNVAIFSRGYTKEGIRLVFPEKQYKGRAIRLVNPMDQENYFALEQMVTEKLKEFNN